MEENQRAYSVQRTAFDGVGYDPAKLIGKRLMLQEQQQPPVSGVFGPGYIPEQHKHDAFYRLRIEGRDAEDKSWSKPDAWWFNPPGWKYLHMIVEIDGEGDGGLEVYVWPLERYRERMDLRKSDGSREGDKDEDEDDGKWAPNWASYKIEPALYQVLEKPDVGARVKGKVLIVDAAIGRRSVVGGNNDDDEGDDDEGIQKVQSTRVIGLQLEGMHEMGWISCGTDRDPEDTRYDLIMTDVLPTDLGVRR